MCYAFAQYTHSTAIMTAGTATLDAVYTRDGVAVAVAEAKTRISYDLPSIEAMGSYLITEDKLDCLCATSKALHVPSFLITELSDGARLYWHIGHESGDPTMEWTVAQSRTLATSVGHETVIRRNAFLPMACAVRWGYGRAAKRADG